MKRRPLGRDLGLTTRMAVALIPIFAWHLVALLLLVVLVIGTLVDREWDAFLGAALFARCGTRRTCGARSSSCCSIGPFSS
jgi:hypothetical protein